MGRKSSYPLLTLGAAVRDLCLMTAVLALVACVGPIGNSSKDAASYSVGGTISGLNSTLSLQNNGADSLAASTNGVFGFSTALPSGTSYNVRVSSQPTGQTCTVSSGSGTVGGNVTTISVNCTVNTYSIGGSITGLAQSGQVLTDNGGDSLAVPSGSTSFSFPMQLPYGASYAVAVSTEATSGTCTVSGGSGTVTGTVTSVAVSCTSNTYSVGGSITGLSQNGLVLTDDGGNALSVTSGSSSFTFSTQLAYGADYAVAVRTQPTAQTCSVANGSGIIGTANVNNVAITCAAATGDEEFVGPFANWINVQTTYGAKGDGVTDDTLAIQNAINALVPTSPVLYFPAGTYKITRTLNVASQLNVGLIGADPSTTTVLWAGVNSSTAAASFTGTISSPSQSASGPGYATLTVANVTGTITPGQVLTPTTGVPTNVFIEKATGANTYLLTSINSFSVAGPEAMTSTNQSMLFSDGMASGSVDRLTFNGQGNIAAAVEESWDGVDNYFDTSNEYADDTFENARFGFRCGFSGGGCANPWLLRDQFINNTSAGFTLGNFNAIGIVVWYSRFLNNQYGASNATGYPYPAQAYNGAGTFAVFNSIFQGNSTDVYVGNTGNFMLQGNYSSNSGRFADIGGSCSQDEWLIQGNTIVNTTQPEAINLVDMGPYILLDNTIVSQPSVTSGPIVSDSRGSVCPSPLFTMGNTFAVGNPATFTSPIVNTSIGPTHSVQDQLISSSTVNPIAPTLPGTPPNKHRLIFEVAPGSTAAQIQAAINSAVASGTTRPVVHLQAGSYSISATLSIPAGTDMQLIGDGAYNTQLKGNGSLADATVLNVVGPSHAILRDFGVQQQASWQGPAILVSHVDQPGSHIFLEQYTGAESFTNLLVNGLDYATVEAHDFGSFYGTSTIPVSTQPGINVIGGPLAAAGNWQGGITKMFGGESAGDAIEFAVSNGGHALMASWWNDAGGCSSAPACMQIASATGSGKLTLANMGLYRPSSQPLVTLGNFTGTAALVSLGGSSSNANITGSGGTDLGLGLADPSPTLWNDVSATPPASTEFLDSLDTSNPPQGTGAIPVPEIGNADPTFLNNTLEDLRTDLPTVPSLLPNGVTDLRLYRVNASYGTVGLQINP